jgi:predicted sulfurtransferase
MRFILLLAMMSAISLAMQTCSKSNMEVKPDVVKTNTNTMTPAPTAAEHNDEAPRISLEEAKKDFDKGNVVFVDTRAESAYKVEHIKGAINIPAESFATRYAEVPKDKKIIAYCS